RMRSALKHRVAAILAKNGVQPGYSDLFGPGGRRFLAELELREGPRRRLDSLLALVDAFDGEIEQTSREIHAPAQEDPYVEVLCQIRGVGRYIAMLVIAEVGDITRFRSARHLCAWAGLTPTVRSSDGKARLGHISRQGSPALRWALVEAAQHTPTRRTPPPARRRPRPQARRPRHKAARPPGHQRRDPPQPPPPLLPRPAGGRAPSPAPGGAPAQGENPGRPPPPPPQNPRPPHPRR